MDPREALLDRCVAHLRDTGFSELSLREIAAGVGTSHRMLIYHFGSRDGLLAAIVGRVEAEQRAALADLAEDVADPGLAGAERLFFEFYAHALYGHPWTELFRAQVIAAWTGPVEEMFAALGFTPAEARYRTRLSLAATRGLLLDLLITGDREILDGASDLFARLITGRLPGEGEREG